MLDTLVVLVVGVGEFVVGTFVGALVESFFGIESISLWTVFGIIFSIVVIIGLGTVFGTELLTQVGIIASFIVPISLKLVLLLFKMYFDRILRLFYIFIKFSIMSIFWTFTD